MQRLRERQRVHASRNPLIVRVLAEVGIMRDEGEGVPRIFEEMTESLLGQPQFSVEAVQFCVVLHNEPVFAGPTAEWHAVVSRLELNTSQRRALLAHPDGFSNEDYRNLNGLDRDAAYREIQDLVARGILLPADSPGRGAVYRPAGELRQLTQWLQERVPRLVEFFQTQAIAKNSDYRKLFPVTRRAATQELRRLVAEGFLVMEGERRGTRYRPGPAIERELEE